MTDAYVRSFLDWLTAGGGRVEFSIFYPSGATGDKPDFYLNRERLTFENLKQQELRWLEDTGQERKPNTIAGLMQRSLQTVLDNGCSYPPRS